MDKSKRTRVMSASSRPIVRARPRRAGGNLPERIEMKMTLSMPRTISRAVSVSRLIQMLASVIQDMKVGNIQHSTSNIQHPILQFPCVEAIDAKLGTGNSEFRLNNLRLGT